MEGVRERLEERRVGAMVERRLERMDIRLEVVVETWVTERRGNG